MAQSISEQTLSIHREQLYAGYINKKKEILEKLIAYQIETFIKQINWDVVNKNFTNAAAIAA